ncbi:MAG: TonB-dependent receptor [Sphingomonadaceae bacterium]
MKNRRYGFWLALGGTILTTGASPAFAQDAPTVSQTGSAQIQDIVVTARRRDENLQQTPIAITAISPVQLESKAAINIGDLQGAAPNVLITNQATGAAAANVSIRGLTFADIDKSFDPTVAVVVDGVFIGTNTGQFFDFFDIDQIEVLRGPQGTLFGRNTIGGVINIRRTRPTGEFGGKFEASYGNYDSWATRAVLNLPLLPDVLAAKLFYFHNESDGYLRDGIHGGRVGGSNNENYGLSLLFTPTSTFDALLTLEKQDQRNDARVSNIARTGEVFCAFQPANECNRNTTGDLYTVFTNPTDQLYKAPAATLEMNWDLDVVKLTSVTGYRETKEEQTQDLDASSADLYRIERWQKFHQFSQELRAGGKIGDIFDYVVGGYYYDSAYRRVQDTTVFGALGPIQRIRGTAKSYALFGDFNVNVTDQIRLSLGGRWTKDKKSSENYVEPDQFPDVKYSGSKFTPKIGVDYQPTDDLMFYASWSRGYRSGGFSGRGQTLFSSTTPYGPETVDSYETGVKSSWFDRRLLVNIAGFYADYSDLQQTTTIPVQGGIGNETIVSNVGSARIKGLEFDVTARPIDNLTINASAGLLRSKFKDFFTQELFNGALTTFDYSENNLIYNPRETVSVTADYKIPLNFGDVLLTGGYRNIAPYDQQISLGATTVNANGVVIVHGNDPRVRTDRQHLLDASASLAFDLNGNRARITAFGRNLANDRGAASAFTVAGLWSFATAREPRTYGVQLGYEF